MAKANLYSDKLTPSAKEALDDTLFEFQELLINRANVIAQKSKSADKEISLRDILEAKDALFNIKIEQEKSSYKRRRLMTVISLTGVLYSFGGIFLYIYQNTDFLIEKNLGLVLAFTGVILTLAGFVYTQLLARRYEGKEINSELYIKNSDSDYDVIKRWQIIEMLGSNIMRQKGYSDNESKSINNILNFLTKELDDKKLYLELRELLSVRNKILHEGYELGRNEKQVYLESANNIIKLLEQHESKV